MCILKQQQRHPRNQQQPQQRPPQLPVNHRHLAPSQTIRIDESVGTRRRRRIGYHLPIVIAIRFTIALTSLLLSSLQYDSRIVSPVVSAATSPITTACFVVHSRAATFSGRRKPLSLSSGAQTMVTTEAESSSVSPQQQQQERQQQLQQQQQQEQQQQQQHLVLVGGGHAHVQVIKALNAASRPSHLKVTLIDAQASASYSGMVPGAIARAYTSDETLIHLPPLAHASQMDFIHDRVVDIDLEQKCVYLASQPTTPIAFDVISLDIGSTSRDLDATPGARDFTIPTRPIDQLVTRLQQARNDMLRERTTTTSDQNVHDTADEHAAQSILKNGNTETTNVSSDAVSSQQKQQSPRSLPSSQQQQQQQQAKHQRPKLVVVGAGAAGIELSMAITSTWRRDGLDPHPTLLLDAGSHLVPHETDLVRHKLAHVLADHHIQVQHNCQVHQVVSETEMVVSTSTVKDNEPVVRQERIPFTHCVWATGAGAHSLAWRLHQLRGLDVTEHGWIRVQSTLQSTSHPFVFAAGDCASIESSPKHGSLSPPPPPKAGVYAVRAGPILIENLTKFLEQLQQDEQQEEEELGGDSPNSNDATTKNNESVNGNKEENDSYDSSLASYKPQDDFLKLLVCGDGKAIGFRFGIPFYGKWVFDMKDRIDSNFMNLFRVSQNDNNDDPKEEQEEPTKRSNDANNTNNNKMKKKKPKYNTAQYDQQDVEYITTSSDPKKWMPPREAAHLIQREDDDVNFLQAWNVLRTMAEHDDYRQAVLKYYHKILTLDRRPNTPTTVGATATTSTATQSPQQQEEAQDQVLLERSIGQPQGTKEQDTTQARELMNA